MLEVSARREGGGADGLVADRGGGEHKPPVLPKQMHMHGGWSLEWVDPVS